MNDSMVSSATPRRTVHVPREPARLDEQPKHNDLPRHLAYALSEAQRWERTLLDLAMATGHAGSSPDVDIAKLISPERQRARAFISSLESCAQPHREVATSSISAALARTEAAGRDLSSSLEAALATLRAAGRDDDARQLGNTGEFARAATMRVKLLARRLEAR